MHESQQQPQQQQQRVHEQQQQELLADRSVWCIGVSQGHGVPQGPISVFGRIHVSPCAGTAAAAAAAASAAATATAALAAPAV